MRAVYTEIRIEAPRSAVWKALTDMPAYRQWNPFLDYREGEIQLGATLKLIVKLPGAWDTPTQVRVISIDHERELGWVGHFLNIPHLIDGSHSFELIDAENRRTTLIQKEHFEGVLLPFFFGWFTQKKIKLGMERMNLALKQWVEGQNKNTVTTAPR